MKRPKEKAGKDRSNMSENFRVVVDAFGGDNAPAEPVKGAVLALKAEPKLSVILTGKEELIREQLSGMDYPEDRLSIVDAREVIVTGEAPVASIQKKKDSSLVVGLQLVRKGEADAFVSAGNTGSVLVGGQVIARKARGVARAPLATIIPNAEGCCLLVDSGANVDARPEHLVQFAVMGSAYMKHVMNVDSPRVALANIGVEPDKGNALTKETYALLSEREDINFIGNLEVRDIPAGGADVIVCEAFTGNVILKMYEGTVKTFLKVIKEGLMTSTRSKIGGLLIKPALKETIKAYDVNQYGGAPLLGLRGLVVKCHGNATAEIFKNAVLQCAAFIKSDIGGIISRAFASEPEEG